jgi:hypothetical protein
MRQRCLNPTGGIALRTFLLTWVQRPPMHSLDRINNDGDYTPKNCRWANANVQNNNRRNSIAKVLPVLQRRAAIGDLSEAHIPGRTQRNPRQVLSAKIKLRRSAKLAVTATGGASKPKRNRLRKGGIIRGGDVSRNQQNL